MKNTIHCDNVNAGLEAKKFLTVVYEMCYLYACTLFLILKLKSFREAMFTPGFSMVTVEIRM